MKTGCMPICAHVPPLRFPYAVIGLYQILCTHRCSAFQPEHALPLCSYLWHTHSGLLVQDKQSREDY